MITLGEAIWFLRGDSEDLDKTLDESEKKTTSTVGRVNDFLKNVAVNVVSGFVSGGLSMVAEGATEAAGAVFSFAQQANQNVKDLQATFGLTQQEAQHLGDISKAVFKDNFGNDLADANESLLAVKQTLRGISDDELQSATENALRLRDVFGKEVPESTAAVNALMSNFNLTQQQAFDFITKGLQGGLDASGDFLDSITEYSTQFSNGGATAAQFFSTMETGMQNGVLGTDKAADAFKEFNVRILDGSTTTRAGLEQLGINADELTNKIASGAMTQTDAFQLVLQKLREAPDDMTRMQAGVALIGSQFEDLGMDSVLALDLTKTKLDDMAGATDSLNAKYADFPSLWEGFKREAIVALEPIAQGLLSIANEALPYLSAGLKTAVGIITVVGDVVGDLIKEVRGFVGAAPSIDTVTGSLGQLGDVAKNVFSGYQAIANSVMGIVNGFLDKHKDEIDATFGEGWATAQEIWKTALEIYNSIVPPVLNFIAGLIRDHSSEIELLFGAAWEAIQAVFKTVLGVIQGVLHTVLGIMHGDTEETLNGIKEIFSSVFEGVKGLLTAALNAILALFNTNLSSLEDRWQTAWNNLQTKVSDTISGIRSSIQGFIDRTVQMGENMISGMTQGVLNKAGELVDSVVNSVMDALNSAEEALGIRSPSERYAETGENSILGILQGMLDALPDLMNGIQDITDEMVAQFEDAAGKISDTIHQIQVDAQHATTTMIRSEADALRQLSSMAPDRREYDRLNEQSARLRTEQERLVDEMQRLQQVPDNETPEQQARRLQRIGEITQRLSIIQQTEQQLSEQRAEQLDIMQRQQSAVDRARSQLAGLQDEVSNLGLNDPRQIADYLSMRRRQILDMADLQQQLAAAGSNEERAAIQRQIDLEQEAQASELEEFRLGMQDANSELQDLAQAIRDLINEMPGGVLGNQGSAELQSLLEQLLSWLNSGGSPEINIYSQTADLNSIVGGYNTLSSIMSSRA